MMIFGDEWSELGLEPLRSHQRCELPDGRIALSDGAAVTVLEASWVADRLPATVKKNDSLGQWLTSVLTGESGTRADRSELQQWAAEIVSSPENQARAIGRRRILPVEVAGVVVDARYLERGLQVLREPEMDVRRVEAPGGPAVLFVGGPRAYGLASLIDGTEPIASYPLGQDTGSQSGLGFGDENEEQDLNPDVDEELREELRDDFGEEFVE